MVEWRSRRELFVTEGEDDEDAYDEDDELLPIGDANNVPLALNDGLYSILGDNVFPTPLMFL